MTSKERPVSCRCGRVQTTDRATPPMCSRPVTFSLVSFREGHDIIGVHLRLTSPTGEESLHRLAPQNDGTDRWAAEVALDEPGSWAYRFEGFSDDFATWAHAAEL